ncbi:MAG: DNA polymerase III subunit beta [Erysipelotrichaceae bacterium]|nr:DNA polymerase III subunit beta [Erysipelotrichaceae bacterium]
MNFKISKKELLDALNKAVRAISTTTPLPSLSGIKLEIKKDSITLISSDSNISIKTVLTNNDKEVFTVQEEGDIVIDSRYILEIVRKIDSDAITFETIDGTLIRIYGGNSEFKLNCMRAEEYPEINFAVNGEPFKFETEKFFDIIDETAFACSDKDTRPILTGVNFKAEDGKLYVNATDSYRLASKTVDVDKDLDFNITIPSVYLNDVYHSLSLEKEIEIAIDNQKISFIFDDSLIQTRLLDDIFPDVSKLIPTNLLQKVTVKSRDLLNALDRTSFIKSDGKNIVKLSINEKEIDITSSNQIGSSYENIDVISFEGQPFEISCSGKYLVDAIKAVGSDEVTLSFSGELKPFIVTNKEDDSIIQLISPVRTYK